MSPGTVDAVQARQQGACIQIARSLHFLVLCWFLFFIVVHVTLVFTTGRLAELESHLCGTDTGSWVGFTVFAVSMAMVIRRLGGGDARSRCDIPRWCSGSGSRWSGPRSGCSSTSTLRLGEYTEKDISPYFWHNGEYPDSTEYRALFTSEFAD